MKTRFGWILFSLLVIICLGVYAAATEQWSSPEFTYIGQIRDDGSGGCAILGNEGPNTNTVVWLDKKGNILYTKTRIGIVTIAACTKKQCAYVYKESHTNNASLIQVDSKGEETVVQIADTDMTAPGKYTKPLEDKKGYFLVLRTMATKRERVTRFTYK